MSKQLFERIPDRVIQTIVSKKIKEASRTKLKKAQHWSECISDKALYQELIKFYFPDEIENLKPLLDKTDNKECEAILRHGVPFRYGHLQGVQSKYLMSVLTADYREQEQLLDDNPVGCLTTNYVAARSEDEGNPFIEFKHVSELAAAKQDAKALFLMLNAYKKLCEHDNDHMYSSNFFKENYNDIQQERAFLKEPRLKLSFINFDKVSKELDNMAFIENIDSIADIDDPEKFSELKKKKAAIQERRRELAKMLINGIKAITQKTFPKGKQYSQKEWPFVDFNAFYNFYMKNGLQDIISNDNEPPKPKH